MLGRGVSLPECCLGGVGVLLLALLVVCGGAFFLLFLGIWFGSDEILVPCCRELCFVAEMSDLQFHLDITASTDCLALSLQVVPQQ